MLACIFYCGCFSVLALAVAGQLAMDVAIINANSGIGDGTFWIPDFLELRVVSRFSRKQRRNWVSSLRRNN
ncbi:hypothetical protein [Ralstonia pseudosolanacearum]|uniref:hypothetical protein n=1 Tax=Ralstonia pseudosolanacearum TaxID=1310165 RepID=UPI001160CCAF|nr:hypothetical protein [Ralstonia pseudosolanacearum]QWF60866.1 hypothetical protein KM864_17255 [Ralstonia solanacearum]